MHYATAANKCNTYVIILYIKHFSNVFSALTVNLFIYALL